MELSPKSLRAAELFTRMEAICNKHRNGFDCIICCKGGSSIFYAINKHDESLVALEQARKTVLPHCGTDKELIKAFEDRREELLHAFPLEMLDGVWKNLFEMMEEEGLDKRGFIRWCHDYFKSHPDGQSCCFADSGWEGWLYRTAQPIPKPVLTPKPIIPQTKDYGGGGPIW